MNKWIILIAMISLMGLVSPVASGEVYLDYDFPEGVSWQTGGFEVYDIIVRGEIAGQGKVSYSSIEMMNEDAYRVEWEQSWASSETETTQINLDVKMRASDLKAHMSSLITTIGDREWRFEGNYTGQSLEFISYFPGEDEPGDASMMISSRFHDADLLPFLLRNIPFVQGNFVTLSIVDVASHSFMTPIPRVIGTEIVETSNTQYDCWIVSWSIGGETYQAWYSRNDKHYLVKIRYPDRELLLNYHS